MNTWAFSALTQINWLIDEMSRRSYYRFSKKPTWQPALNVYEDEGHVHLCLELAGLAREQIHVEVVERKLTVRGQRQVHPPLSARQPRSVLRIEIDSGPFERTVELPDFVNTDSVEAKLQDGFLWITIARQ